MDNATSLRIYKEAKRESFSMISETCPDVEAALDLITRARGTAEELIKDKTAAFREALIEALERAIEAECKIAELEGEIAGLRNEIVELEKELAEV